MGDDVLGRRDFLRRSLQVTGGIGLAQVGDTLEGRTTGLCTATNPWVSTDAPHAFNGIYQGESLSQIAFPMGGMGAGMVCLEGSGVL